MTAVGIAAAGLSFKTFGISEIKFFFYSLGTTALILLTLPITIPILFCVPLIALGIATSLIHAHEDFKIEKPLLWLRVPLLPSSYSGLGSSRYYWGLFYYYGYLLAFSAVILLILIVAALVVGFSLRGPNLIRVPILKVLSFFLVWAIARVAVYPYTALLISSTKNLTTLMARTEFYDVKSAAVDLCSFVKNSSLPKCSSAVDPKKFSRDQQGLVSLTGSLTKEIRRAKLRFIHASRVRGLARNSQEFSRHLGHVPWVRVAESIKFLSPDRHNSTFLHDLSEASGQVLDYGEDSSIANLPVFDDGKVAANELFDTLEDAVLRARALADRPGELTEHFESLLTESLEKEIPEAWSRVIPNSTAFKSYVRRLRTDHFEEVMSMAGRDLNNYPAVQQAVDFIRQTNKVRYLNDRDSTAL